MIGFFDFDMTSAVTKGKETPSLSQFRNVEFATQDILNAKPTKLVQRMKKYNQVYILTARSSGCGKMRKAIKNYFMKNGLYIPNKNILMVGDYMQDKKTAEKKAIVLNRFTSINKQVVHFWDDDSNNVEYAKSVKLVKAFQV